MSDNIILHGDIVLKGFEELTILSLKIFQTLNEHSTLTLCARLEEEDKDNYADKLTLNRSVEASNFGETIFTGVITRAAVKTIRSVNYVELTCLSHTYLMDIESESKSFQDKNMTYEDLVKTITQDYPNASFMDKTTNGKKIGKPIIQYNETDWEFLKRVASHFNVPLIPDIRGKGPQFYFGLPDTAKGSLMAWNYMIEKDLNAYRAILSDVPSVSSSDFAYIHLETEKFFSLGDGVTFNTLPMHVVETSFEYEDAVIKNECELSLKNGTLTPFVPNDNISGCSIFGKVLDVARDNIKIHLEIDETQDVAKAFWYPYASMYASKEETGWYCMPEKGDIIRLYHPKNSEDEAMAISSVKPHDPNENVEQLDPEHRMADPDVKYLRTAFGKEIKLRPDGIDIIAKDGTVFMSMNDDGSVNLNSNDKISLTASNDIEMKARNINIEAQEKLNIISKGSSIKMSDDIVIKGKEVKTN
ncbi:MAG: phage late control D family protein [Clostridiales bacterium]|jgi:hypothetical protein|nr:phage late control D family protein [Clostridiales bacterium]